jgi:hypothetical protein
MKNNEPAKVGNDTSSAKEAMTDMPPRREDELDAVTLHNQALVYAEDDPTAAFNTSLLTLHTPLRHSETCCCCTASTRTTTWRRACWPRTRISPIST